MIVAVSTSAAAPARYARLERALEWPMVVLALAVVPALIFEDRATSESVRAFAVAVNWFVWLAFVFEFLLKLALCPDRGACLRSGWFNLTLIVLSPPFLVPDALQSTRSLRALRLVRLLRLVRAGTVAGIGLRTLRRLLRHRGFEYVLCAGISTVALGAIGIYIVERGQTVQTLGDAFWWAIVTVTTVGYGDVAPKTGEGRMIAVVLMLVGISVVSVFTATLASFFLTTGEESETARLERRLNTIEVKVDEIAKALKERG